MPAPKITSTDRRLFTTLWDTLPVQKTPETRQQLERVQRLQVEYQIYLEEILMNPTKTTKTIQDVHNRLERLNSAERYFIRALYEENEAWLPPIPEEKEIDPEPDFYSEMRQITQEESTSTVNCVICIFPIIDGHSASLKLYPCEHATHVTCAMQWTRFNPDSGCPMCNQVINHVDILDQGDGKELAKWFDHFAKG